MIFGKEINLFVEFLRIIACLGVVSLHFGSHIPGAGFAVPLFMFFAFYFWIPRNDVLSLARRECRLLVPYLFWGLIGVIVSCVDSDVSAWNLVVRQIFTGMPANAPLYFLTLLIVNTLVIYLVVRFAGKYGQKCLLLLLGACVLLHYSAWNEMCWDRFPSVRLSYGRIDEMLPFAISGHLIGRLQRTKGSKYVIAIAGMMICLGCGLVLFGVDALVQGYGYAGLVRLLLSVGIAACVGASGYLVRLNDGWWSRMIAYVASLTPGIYFCHSFIGNFLSGVVQVSGLLLTVGVFALSGLMVIVLMRNDIFKMFVR